MLPVLGGSFWPAVIIHNKSYSWVLVALSVPLLSVANRLPGSGWLFLAYSYPTLTHNKPYSRVLVALPGPLLSVTNRLQCLGGSFWPTVVPNSSYSAGLGGSFWPTLIRGPFLAHSYSFHIVFRCLGGSFLSTLMRNKSYSPGLGGSLLSHSYKSYARALVALSSPLLSVTNHAPGSWWLFLAHSLSITNRSPGSWWLFLAHSYP